MVVKAWDMGSVWMSRHGTRVACGCQGMGLEAASVCQGKNTFTWAKGSIWMLEA